MMLFKQKHSHKNALKINIRSFIPDLKDLLKIYHLLPEDSQ